MTSPIDYSGAFATENPADAMMSGFKNGAAIRALQDKRAAEEQAKLQQQQMQDDMSELSANPTAAKIAQYSIKYPQLSEQFKRSWDMVEPAEKQAKLEVATQVYSALNADKPDIALQLMRDQAKAMRNSGDERGAGATEAMAKAFEMYPNLAKITTGKMLHAMAGPEKFASSFAAYGAEERAAEQAPLDMRIKGAQAQGQEADATTKQVGAKYAEKGALLDLEKKGWDISKIKADIEIAREDNRIKAMNAAISRQGNDLKRQELQLKIEEAITTRDDKVREKVAKAESGINAMDNMLNTIERTLKSPGLNDVLGSIEGNSLYPNQLAAGLTALNPMTSSGDDRADAQALVETLGSQAFLSQVPTVQGMGSLSNAEGEKLQSALQNLSRKQSEKQFRANLEEARRLVSKSRENVSKRYGAPLPSPDTPAVRNSRPPLSSFNR